MEKQSFAFREDDAAYFICIVQYCPVYLAVQNVTMIQAYQ